MKKIIQLKGGKDMKTGDSVLISPEVTHKRMSF